MSTMTLDRMKIFHGSRPLGKALARLDGWRRRSLDGRQAARRSEAQDIGTSNRNWQRLLQTSDFWRYL